MVIDPVIFVYVGQLAYFAWNRQFRYVSAFHREYSVIRYCLTVFRLAETNRVLGLLVSFGLDLALAVGFWSRARETPSVLGFLFYFMLKGQWI